VRLDQATGQNRTPHNDFVPLNEDILYEKVSEHLSHSLMEPIDSVEAAQVLQLMGQISELDVTVLV
jgi:hypothetical protein